MHLRHQYIYKVEDYILLPELLLQREKRPILRLGYYREIARIWPGGGVSLEREVIVLSLVFEILGLIKQELPHSVLYFKEELKRFLSAKKDYVDYFFSIKEDVYRYSITLFYPKKITKEVVNKIDWEDLTDNFDLETIQDIVDTLGRDNKEKLIIVESIFEAEASTGNMAAIPYDVFPFLLNTTAALMSYGFRLILQSEILCAVIYIFDAIVILSLIPYL